MTSANLDRERFLAHHRLMCRIRELERAALRGLDDGLVLGAIHPSIGQEAIAAGICANLRQKDIMLSTHRGHGHTLAKGADPEAMMRELFGRVGGNCGGKGGSMHIADFNVGMLGANGIVGANIVIAAGAAQAIELHGDDRIVVCIFGDGAINRGPFLEGLNWAAAYNLPVLFVCESNGYAATTKTADLTAGGGPAARADSMGIESHEVDGNDIVAMDEIGRRLIGEVRETRTPRFLMAHTYRLTGHTGSDPAAYRPDGEADSKWADEPIARSADLLKNAGATDAELAAMQTEAVSEMSAIFDSARAADWPAAEIAFEDVQDLGTPEEGAARW